MGTRYGASVLTAFFEKVPIFKGLRADTQRYLHPKADFLFRKTGVPHLERRFFMPVSTLQVTKKHPAEALSFSITSYHIFERMEVTN